MRRIPCHYFRIGVFRLVPNRSPAASTFRVWAPEARRVAGRFCRSAQNSTAQNLTREASGYFSGVDPVQLGQALNTISRSTPALIAGPIRHRGFNRLVRWVLLRWSTRPLCLERRRLARACAAGSSSLRDAHRHVYARGNMGGRGRATGRIGVAGRHGAGNHADCRVCRQVWLELRSGQFVCPQPLVWLARRDCGGSSTKRIDCGSA